MGALKVNNVEIVNSTANVITTTLPTLSGVVGAYGNATHSATITVAANGIVTTTANNALSDNFTSRVFESSHDASYAVTVSTSAPSGGANGDIWYQTYS
tara:strand:+ start:217 stop:513 length:297 start_codon:yes stop_codon:yes gene_type:complete